MLPACTCSAHAREGRSRRHGATPSARRGCLDAARDLHWGRGERGPPPNFSHNFCPRSPALPRRRPETCHTARGHDPRRHADSVLRRKKNTFDCKKNFDKVWTKLRPKMRKNATKQADDGRPEPVGKEPVSSLLMDKALQNTLTNSRRNKYKKNNRNHFVTFLKIS